MFFFTNGFGSEINEYQLKYCDLAQQFNTLQSQFNHIQTENAVLQEQINKIDQKTTQINYFPGQNRQKLQEISKLTLQKKNKRKTNKFQSEQNSVLLEFKQNNNFLNLKKQYKRNHKTLQTFYCTFDSCQKTYKSSFSLNLHIKVHHNGGSKRQRQRYATLIFQAIQKGQPFPKVPINFPPNFLEEFKSSFEYMKKYKM